MVSLEARTYVPYEPTTDEQRATRNELRAMLRRLTAAPGEILCATLAGSLPAKADLENALFYNLDARGVFSAMQRGVMFEFDPMPMLDGVRYTYQLAPDAQEFRHWQAVRTLGSLLIELEGARLTLSSIWWALKSTRGAIEARGRPREDHERFLMTLTVSGPAPGLNALLLKTLLDGTICGLQSQEDSQQLTAVAACIAGSLGVPATAVQKALLEGGASPIGVRARLVHERGTGVQWSPDDDRCVAARVQFSPGAQWRISGEVAVGQERH